ncbi:MAG: AAA family ATPase [Lachnospiraceae bacterium]|nr:AAA family ATPase [Lachnospiraceae bacterium]
MARNVAIGIQSFEDLIKNNYFYIDKTDFIKEWWDSGDSVTLITRPRRFGKTLNMSMIEQFFSVNYADRGELFEGLSIWQDEKYRQIQGTYPVISLSFAGIKEINFTAAREKICQLLTNLYLEYSFLRESDALADADKKFFDRILATEIRDSDATFAIHQLSKFLYQYYGKRAIILLDEYDTPMQEAYINEFWDELVAFTRSMFNSAFKTNPYLERGLMTGITRVSKESIFSDLNNLEVVTTTSDKYATAFGFTEDEVFAALDECGLSKEKDGVKAWYDGFVFGKYRDIYNPWSVLNFIDKKEYGTYWANTSGNRLVGKLIREGGAGTKEIFEQLLKGEVIQCPIDEQIVYNQLDYNEDAIWSLLLASGYLKVLRRDRLELLGEEEAMYDLVLTNHEVKRMFYTMVRGWFSTVKKVYNDFVTAMLRENIKEMNIYMNRVTLETFSYFDTGKRASGIEPERFYHGFVLGLVADLSKDYVITSNRESGYGRYDVMLEPKDKANKAFILEFKIHEPEEEDSLRATVDAALKQIEEKQYEASLIARGFDEDRICKYGFAFEGKKVLIGM